MGWTVLLASIFAGLAAISLALFAYPYLFYPVVLRLLPKQPPSRNASPTADWSVSLLFCAFNERRSLPAKIANLQLLKNRRPDLQILAYDDGSSDGTQELLTSVPELVTLVRGPGRTGKAAGMKRLVQAARGDILVFTDANVLLEAEAIDRLLIHYGDPAVGGVCGTLTYSADPGSATAKVGAAYWSLDEKLRSLESRTGNVMGADGSIFSIRRALYPDFPDSVLDDLTVSMGVIFAGYRLIKAADVLAFENGVARRKDELRRKIRIGMRAYHTHMFLRDKLRRMNRVDRFKYGSRKVMRWFGGLFIAGAALCALAAVAVLSGPAAVAVLAAAAALALVSLYAATGPLAGAAEIVLAVFATLIGVVRAMRGEVIATWEPAKTR